MKIGIFSVYDSKAESYLAPFYAPNGSVACRSLQQATQDPSHPFCLYPEDYTLFEIGSFEDETGELTNLPANRSLISALEAKSQKKE